MKGLVAGVVLGLFLVLTFALIRWLKFEPHDQEWPSVFLMLGLVMAIAVIVGIAITERIS